MRNKKIYGYIVMEMVMEMVLYCFLDLFTQETTASYNSLEFFATT